jgi:hypothetical protein
VRWIATANREHLGYPPYDRQVKKDGDDGAHRRNGKKKKPAPRGKK